MKKLLLATVAAVGLAALPGIAHATLTWTIFNNVNATGTNAVALQASPDGFNAAAVTQGAIPITGTSTNGNLNLSSAPNNLLANFLPADFILTGGNPAGLVMSNVGNTNTTSIRITETYSLAAPFAPMLTHDDGATIFVGGTAPANMICGAPGPTSQITSGPCNYPQGDPNLTLYYEESFGAPAVLQTMLPPEKVPEPASLALLGSALLGFGVFKRRRTG